MSVSVLLVEDNPNNMEAKKQYLATFDDCDVLLGVSNSDEAIHALRTLPHFGLVIADIDLSQSSKTPDEPNMGGVALARWLKQTNYPAYVAGYSGIFDDDQLSEEDKEVFDDFADRSVGGTKLGDKVSLWIKSAGLIDRDAKLKSLIAEAYQNTQRDPQSRPVPVVSMDTLVDYNSDDVEEIRKNGFELSLILPEVNDEIKKAIPVWVRNGVDETLVEVLGQPFLFASGKTRTEAISALKSLICGYHEDLAGKNPDKEMGPYVKIMFRFLDAIFS